MRVVREALQVAWNPDATTPFTRDAEAHDMLMSGGKLDDTTVVVSLVVSSPGDGEEL